MSDSQLIIIVSGVLLLAVIVSSFVYLSSKQNRAQAIALAEQLRASQPAMDTLERLAQQVVPVQMVFATMALILPFLPVGTPEEKKLQGLVADILKSLSDGKPWTPPAFDATLGAPKPAEVPLAPVTAMGG